jgi:putative ABC transport system permease protein
VTASPRNQRRFGANLRSLLRWRRASDDVAEEMQLHEELRARELEAEGVPAAEARRRAAREVGRPADVVPLVSALATRGDRVSAIRQAVDEVRLDVKYAVRSCLHAPAFTLLIVLTMGLGLGANAAIFGVVQVAVLNPLPFDRDNTLVRVREYRKMPDGTRLMGDGSRRTADAIAQRPDLFTSTVPLSGVGRTLMRDSGPAVRVAAMRVGPGFTKVVGITPILGRTFTAEEELAGDASGVALVSHRFWQQEMGGGETALGQVIRLNNQSYRVVGVLPASFHVPYRSDVWFPSRFAERERSIFILARLVPGIDINKVQSALEIIGVQLNKMYPDDMGGLGVVAVRARDYFVGEEDRMSIALMGAVALLLLIGCTNVAVLLTTKFASRAGEVSVRAALGCSRARQVRQFVTEGVLLFCAGGAAGLLLAMWLKDVLVVFLPQAIATQVGIEGIPFDFRMVGFATAVSVLSGIGFGLVAARRASTSDLGQAMKAGGRTLAGSAVRGTLGKLVVAEVALAIVLLASAGVMVETFRRLQSRDLGFEPEQMLTLRFDLTASRYESAEARRLVLDRVMERVRQLPASSSVGMTTVNPVCCGNWGMRVTPEGYPPATAEQTPVVQHFVVSPGYFETMGQQVVQGRAFDSTDVTGGTASVIVDKAAADRFWPGQSPLGKRIKRGTLDQTDFPWLTVVGVVETVIDEGRYTEAWYLPFGQNATAPSATGAHLMVRAGADPNALIPDIRAIVSEIDPELALYEFATMTDLVAENIKQDRLGAMVASLFAMAGLLLAALGLYGVLAFAVNADRREIGVRLALGASRIDVLRLVAGRGLRLSAIGTAIGVVAAYGVSIWLGRLVEGARLDVRLLMVAVAVLLAAAILAIVVPARRAIGVDPLTSIRAD